VKVAATPATLDENLDLLAYSSPGVSVIGMGERGLYSRVMGPYRGSELTFVSRDDRAAAPGQLSLERALAIFGSSRESLHAKHVFAIAGNPVGHSLSPSIQNAMFRDKGADAAYTFASAESFDEVAALLDSGTLRGVSVTAPFKEDALKWARSRRFTLGEQATRCGSVNTIVMGPRPMADNTDVDGFRALLGSLCGRDRKTIAIVGAGGTARAALLAAQHLEMAAIVFNRTLERAELLAQDFSNARTARIDELPVFQPDIVVDTTPSADFTVDLRPGTTYIRAAYGTESPVEARARRAGAAIVDGYQLLHSQAIRQNELFMQGIE
jgi:3-dehydroquinate dehydratase/shikimate dehydrogenase